MSFSVPTAFAGAELEYRQQRIKAEFPGRTARILRPQRRIRIAALFHPRRRPNLTPRGPMPAPHHLASGR